MGLGLLVLGMQVQCATSGSGSVVTPDDIEPMPFVSGGHNLTIEEQEWAGGPMLSPNAAWSSFRQDLEHSKGQSAPPSPLCDATVVRFSLVSSWSWWGNRKLGWMILESGPADLFLCSGTGSMWPAEVIPGYPEDHHFHI